MLIYSRLYRNTKKEPSIEHYLSTAATCATNVSTTINALTLINATKVPYCKGTALASQIILQSFNNRNAAPIAVRHSFVS